jgi:hypothetical protein
VRQTILVVWNYKRADLSEVFTRLSDSFDFHFIYYKNPSFDSNWVNPHSFQVHYWEQFTTPAKLLSQLKPRKIIFADIESYLDLALNAVSHRKRIPTYILAHGQRGGYEVHDAYKRRKVAEQNATNQSSQIPSVSYLDPSTDRLHTLRFLLRALRWQVINPFGPWWRFLLARKYNELTIALFEHQFESRRANFYLELSEDNCSYHRVRDGVPDSRFIIIGNPAFDVFFQQAHPPVELINRPYALLLDTPADDPSVVDGPSHAQRLAFWQKLNEACYKQGLHLVIKLHPRTAQNEQLIEHSNISYFRETYTLPALIRYARFGFGVITSLLPVLAYHCPTTIFCFRDDPFQQQLVASGMVNRLDYHDYTPDTIYFESQQKSSALMQAFVSKFLFSADGLATERLRAILTAGPKTI